MPCTAFCCRGGNRHFCIDINQERTKPMTNKIAVLLIALAATVHAEVVDLTPGGFNPGNPPQVYTDWLNEHFQHDAIHLANDYSQTGWDTTLIGNRFFSATPLGNATVMLSYNVARARFVVAWIFISGTAPGDIGWLNMYEVTGNPDALHGDFVLTVNNDYPITAISVYGLREHIPPR
jgi:hypothetical protein